MTWGKKRSQEHRKRSRSLDVLTTAVKATMDVPYMNVRLRAAGTDGADLPKRLEQSGSRGGAPIWQMKECWMPSPCSCHTGPSVDCRLHGPRRRINRLMSTGGKRKKAGKWEKDAAWRAAMAGGHDRGFPDAEAGADPDGLAVFGRYPKGWLEHVIRLRFLGTVSRHEILHVCAGTLGPTEAWTVDLRAEAQPRVVADGRKLPFRDASFKAIMLDPPYSEAYARNLYGTDNPRPSWLLAEAARVVVPCGRIGILHVAIPFAPPNAFLVGCWGISIGVGFRGRFFSVYEREQAQL